MFYIMSYLTLHNTQKEAMKTMEQSGYSRNRLTYNTAHRLLRVSRRNTPILKPLHLVPQKCNHVKKILECLLMLGVSLCCTLLVG